MLQLGESSMKPQKTTGQPKDPLLATRAPHSHSIIPQAHGQNSKNSLAEKAITNIRNMGGTEGTTDQEPSC